MAAASAGASAAARLRRPADLVDPRAAGQAERRLAAPQQLKSTKQASIIVLSEACVRPRGGCGEEVEAAAAVGGAAATTAASAGSVHRLSPRFCRPATRRIVRRGGTKDSLRPPTVPLPQRKTDSEAEPGVEGGELPRAESRDKRRGRRSLMSEKSRWLRSVHERSAPGSSRRWGAEQRRSGLEQRDDAAAAATHSGFCCHERTKRPSRMD